MNIYRALKLSIARHSRSKRNWIERTPERSSQETASRQTMRRGLREAAQRGVSQDYPEMPRKDRRRLARALAAKEWHKIKEASHV
jgi:hypothetical protein